jgi:hypothetical protein
MSKETIINKVVDEVIDTLVDNLEELTTHYMYEVGGYTESNSEFVVDHEKICDQVVKELYNRINKE